jgi:cation diffusion facilitator family transporter
MRSSLEEGRKLRVLKISTVAISTAAFLELILGLAVSSLAILSDGLHASLDALTTFGLFIATCEAIKPPDSEHTYGHEKFESLGGLVGGIVLIGTALWIMFEAVQRVLRSQPYLNQEFELAGFFAIGYTFFIDFLRVGTFSRVDRMESSTLNVGFYHALSDLASTIIALLGFGLATIGIYYGDVLASIFLSALLICLSLKAIWRSGMELSDAISKDILEKVRGEILSVSGVCECGRLKVRKAGAKTFIEATVKVPEDTSLEEAHALASKIEESVKAALGETETTIHVEPLRERIKTESLIKEIASEVEGVKEAHKVRAVYNEGKLYITLHARVNPELSVQQAHEITERIENKINEKINDVENVTVHIEPFDAKKGKTSEFNEEKIRQVIQKTMEKFPQALRCKRIVTYVADKRRYISIDCTFSKQISIEEAHKIASQIEKNVKKHFKESTITVHTEPD